MRGKLINNKIRERSTTGESSLIGWGGISDWGEVVSSLLEWGMDLLL